jgi:hypothetical protein
MSIERAMFRIATAGSAIGSGSFGIDRSRLANGTGYSTIDRCLVAE